MNLKISVYIVANKDEQILLVDDKAIITSTEHVSEVPIRKHIIVIVQDQVNNDNVLTSSHHDDVDEDILYSALCWNCNCRGHASKIGTRTVITGGYSLVHKQITL